MNLAKAKKAIKLAYKRNSKSLDLSHFSLTFIPKEVFNLSQLEVLYLGVHKFRSNLLTNDITSVPKAIRKLKNLKKIDISNSKLTQFPIELLALPNLEEVYLSNNRIEALPSEIEKLNKLKTLYLNNNKIRSIADELFEIANLQSLNVNNNLLETIPNFGDKSKKIFSLNISHNSISKLPASIGNLSNLKILDVSHNQLSILPNSLYKLKKMISLNIGGNKIYSISPNIKNLLNLQQITARNNELTNIPEEFSELKMLKFIELENNPIISPPIEIVMRGIKSIKEYFEGIKNDEEIDFLYEIKLLLVGEGRVGKTSISKMLVDNNYVLSKEDSTEGIDINRIVIPKKDLGIKRDMTINVWDFGGQEIYHSTHQFFLTKRSLYILVTESRKEDKHEDFYYWFNIVKILGDKSPLLLVLNKCDQPIKDIPIEEFKKSFNNINGFEKISLAKGFENTRDNLRKKINELLTNRNLLPHLGTPLPKVWVDIRKVIFSKLASGITFISLSEYLALCKTYDLSESSSHILGDFLHDLGVFLYFSDDINLRETIFLDHDWVTKGVYNLLDNQTVISNYGQFTDKDLISIWKDNKYSEKRSQLLALLKKFELCYEIRSGVYLAPQLLKVDELVYPWKTKKNNTLFELNYSFMPKGILTKFIVKRHSDIHEEICWRYGVYLKYKKTSAIVRELYFERKIRIRLNGPHKKQLLAIILKSFSEINSAYNHLEVDEMIQCQCSQCSMSENPYFYKLSTIEKYQDVKLDKIRCHQSLEEVALKLLLDIMSIDFDYGADTSQTMFDRDEEVTKDRQAEILRRVEKIERITERISSFIEESISSYDKKDQDAIDVITINLDDKVVVDERIDDLMNKMDTILTLVGSQENAGLKEYNKIGKQVTSSDLEIDSKAKLKLLIPIIPGLLKFEKELSLDLKSALTEIWEDLKNGDLFVK